MSHATDAAAAALARQYRNGSNLSARQRIYAFGQAGARWPTWVFEQLRGAMPGGRPSASVLEAGCGNAVLWRENLRDVPAGWTVILSDVSPGMLNEARRALASQAPRFAFARLDAQALPFADGRFDAAVANHMLYHVPDRGRAIAEFHRVLRPGGRLLATTNGREHLRPITDLLDRHVPPPATPDELTAAAGTFLLENGEPQLARHFARVEVRWRRGELRVTDPQAIVDYILSIGRAQSVLVGPKLAALGDEVAGAIRDRGYFLLPTATGMCVAEK